MSWVTVSPELTKATIFKRRDVRELLVQVGPLHNMRKYLGSVQWNAILAIGVGLSQGVAARVTDQETKLVGTLRDHPSLRCHFEMLHPPPESGIAKDNFRIHRLVIALEESE